MELKLQAEDSFVLKVVQLEELLQVRHSVFVIGNAGSGKSQAGAAAHSLPAGTRPSPPPRPLRVLVPPGPFSQLHGGSPHLPPAACPG